ncbi:isotrichodermin C-15 hydroxylase [Astrocystis sublimbata]|nr:isotrichodermin C-15 hydroxylase [Astrocystis sublimbata]
MTGIILAELPNFGSVALVAVVSVIAWQAATVVYNLFFHPLRKFPGPALQGASRLPWAIQQIFGVQAHITQRLHEQYGPVVRIGPSHLSFTDVEAYKDIYGHRVGSDLHASEMSKSDTFVRNVRNIPTSIINADREEHSRFRRALSHGFSDSSMRQQEPEIMKYVDLLIRRLHEECDNGSKKLWLEAWFNWTTFDVVGNLVFGQSFNCLENSSTHQWINFILKSIRGGAIIVALTYLGLGELVELAWKMGLLAFKVVQQYTDEMVTKRLAMEKSRVDLFEGLVKKREEWNLSFGKLSSNAVILVFAGSETTATTLSGATYLTLSHPDVHAKLTHEVRSTFKDAREININTVGNLKYMLAVLNEALRMYPPVVSGLVRVTPKGGATVAGHYCPENIFVETQHWSVNHSEDNWADPWQFKPERFLGTSEEALRAGNKLEALQAFSVGPRNCIGRNLAYAEMRVILARLIFDFDMKLDKGAGDWIGKQKSYTLWDRQPLGVYLTPVRDPKV